MKDLCIKLVIKTSLYYDARSEKHNIFLPLLKLVVKKLLELSYILKKKVCIPRSFLVINVCNQGKTLCSPCILRPYIYFHELASCSISPLLEF
jgi:hypothetical protein